MAVRPRGPGWQADVQHEGRRYRETFANKAEAEAWEHEARAALKRGLQVPAVTSRGPGSTGTDTMQGLYDEVVALRWNRLRADSQQGNALRFVNWVGPKLPAREGLAPERIDAFMAHLRAKGSSDATINRYNSAISMLAKQAVRYRRLESKPELEWTKGTAKRLRYFEPDEVALIEQTFRLWGYDREADFFLFLCDTGIRPWIEARRFTWKDLGAKRVTLPANITKNGNARVVPLTQRAWEAVQRQPRDGMGPWCGMNKNSFTSLWRRLRGHLPQLEDTVLYTARHTCASRLVQKGIDLYRVMEWMGHKTITQTQTYAHLAPKHLMDAVNALEAAE